MTQQIHRPLHIFQDNAWYFITAHTYSNQYVLLKDDHKEIFLQNMITCSTQYCFHISAWVILDNHYHFMTFIRESKRLSNFMNQLHGRTSFLLNQIDRCKGRKVWYSFWDRIIRDESEYWAKFNYIHYNPVKHGYVKDPQNWKYSSYLKYVRRDQTK